MFGSEEEKNLPLHTEEPTLKKYGRFEEIERKIHFLMLAYKKNRLLEISFVLIL